MIWLFACRLARKRASSHRKGSDKYYWCSTDLLRN